MQVTITGADNLVEIPELYEALNNYPFLELGILLSQSRRGSERYPDLQWIKTLIECSSLQEKWPPRFSAHICGQWARDIISGKYTLQEYVPLEFPDVFGRVQINTANADSFTYEQVKLICDTISPRGRTEVILPTKNFAVTKHIMRLTEEGYSISALLDKSGGKGRTLDSYQFTSMGKYKLGIAGGINMDNINKVLNDVLCPFCKIREPAWIDLESGVRNELGQWHWHKVRSILETCETKFAEIKYV